MNWEYINGQWLLNGQVSATPPPMNTPFWSTDANGARDFRTFAGPDSMVGVGAPIATTLPRGSGLPVNRFKIPIPGVSGGAGPTPPVPPPSMSPTPAISNHGAIRDGRISGNYFANPESEAPAGYNPELWAQRFAGPPAMNARPVQNFSGQMAPPIMPRVVENPLATYINNDMRMPQKTQPINTNIFSPQLVASIEEAAKYGIGGTGIGKERANFILQALQNPALLGNPARDGNAASMKMMGGAPTNPIDRAGMLFDKQEQLLNGPNRRTPGEDGPATPIPPRPDRERGTPPPPTPPDLLGPLPVTTTTTVAPPEGRRTPKWRNGKWVNNYATGTAQNAFMPSSMFQAPEPAAPLSPEQIAQRDQLEADLRGIYPGMTPTRPPLGTAITSPGVDLGDWQQFPSPRGNPTPAPGTPMQRTFIPPPRGQAARQRGNPFALANPMNQQVRPLPRPARPQDMSRGSAVAGRPNPFLVPRYAEGTAGPSLPTYVQGLQRKGQLTPTDLIHARRTPGVDSVLLSAIQKSIDGQPFVYVNQRQGIDTRIPLAPVAPPPNTTPTAPTAPSFEDGIKAKVDAGTLSMSDALVARKAGNNALADAITRRLAGLPWTYTWAIPTTPAVPTVPATPTTPTTPQPEANPQVMWYDKDVWAKNPTLKYLNGQWSQNQFMTPSSRASYDPATGTTIQSAGSMNAGTFMDIDRDPVRRGLTRSALTRHNRDYEKELSDALYNAPMGEASKYVRTG